MNAHIGSSHRITGNDCMSRFEFATCGETYEAITNSMNFYNLRIRIYCDWNYRRWYERSFSLHHCTNRIRARMGRWMQELRHRGVKDVGY